MSGLKQFSEDSEKKAFDLKYRNTLKQNINYYSQSYQKAIQQYEDYELAKNQAAYIRTQTLEHLDEHLLNFEKKFTQNGGKLIWAEDSKDLLAHIKAIIEEKQIKKVLKSKSAIAEEVELKDFLRSSPVRVSEANLGQYILSLAEQKSSHNAQPTIHLSKKDIADIFRENLEIDLDISSTKLSQTAKNQIRLEFEEADLGITEADFVVADVGGIALSDSSGEGQVVARLPRVHISIVGIEKVLPSVEDLDLFWSLLSSNATGEKVTTYNSLITAPESDSEMYVFLLDNGRTKLLADAQKRQALSCIGCGACAKVCPVFGNIGGQTYGSSYGGSPISAIITPHYKGMRQFKHLSQASSLCGACTEVCPVKIDLQQLLIENRKDIVGRNFNTSSENLTFSFWKRAMLSRKQLVFWHRKSRNFAFKWLFNKKWKKRRDSPEVPQKSFNQIWREKVK